MRRKLVLLATVLLAGFLLIFFMLFLALAGAVVPLDFTLAFGLGWWRFLNRVVVDVRIDRAGLATGLLCVAVFAIGMHAFLAWLYPQMKEEAGRRWRIRWTLAIVSVILLMFVAGMSTVGASHQVGWLVASKEPWVESGRGYTRFLSEYKLKQIGQAIDAYHQGQKSLPPRITFDREGNPLHGWHTATLPYIEQETLYNGINLTLPWDDPRNAASFATVVHGYVNPGIGPRAERDADGHALSHYAGNVNMVRVKSLRDIPDGNSNTIQVGEVAGGFKPWGNPVNWRDPALGVNRTSDGFGGPFVGGASFLFADGSVRFLQNTTDPRIMKALGTPAGGETIDHDSH